MVRQSGKSNLGTAEGRPWWPMVDRADTNAPIFSA